MDLWIKNKLATFKNFGNLYHIIMTVLHVNNLLFLFGKLLSLLDLGYVFVNVCLCPFSAIIVEN